MQVIQECHCASFGEGQELAMRAVQRLAEMKCKTEIFEEGETLPSSDGTSNHSEHY